MKNDLAPIIVYEDSEEKENYYFRVIGEDRKIHVSDLQTHFCKCGVKILRNYVTDKDYSDGTFSCYECTF